MENESSEDKCIGAGSVAGAVIGTFLTTILLLAVAALLYRQWRRHKGKHLVLVTDPEIVDDAYAFDNPCFKDATLSQLGCGMEKPVATSSADTPAKHSPRWSTSWASLALGSGNRADKRKILDDSSLGPKVMRVNVVSLRSHDFTGLGFNVCGNMREGIFVKDLLHRGPASESGRIHPGDRIASVKISFRNMVYEDALTILSYASPYDVELEVESGVTGSKPTTLLKKSVGPSPTHICHPLYRSQSIPELPQAHRTAAKRLFIADPNESAGSNYSGRNSTLKTPEATPGSQSLERRHAEAKGNHHHKFGIKVLPALDGTLHRIENQNEHNTNLERRHSKKLEIEKKHLASLVANEVGDERKEEAEVQQRENPQLRPLKSVNGPVNSLDSSLTDKAEGQVPLTIPSEVPTEVHNAAMAAQRNRRNSSELLNSPRATSSPSTEVDGPKSPQKNKRKAPAPPKTPTAPEETSTPTEKISTVSVNDNSTPAESVEKKEESADIWHIREYSDPAKSPPSEASEVADTAKPKKHRSESVAERRHSESDTDNEMQNSFTTIELDSADITIHRTPVPEVAKDEDDDDDVYRKAASLGDLSKYECKASATLERAQSLDMTDAGSKKRKAPLPPEDINESTEDLTKLDQIDTFDRRKLKKSNEWGTLEDVLWNNEGTEEKSKDLRVRKKSNGTLERSKSAVEIKLKNETADSWRENETSLEDETSLELYNLPLSKRLTHDFLLSERNFDPSEDNSLARIVNDGRTVKSPTMEEVDMDFRRATSPPNDYDDDDLSRTDDASDQDHTINDDFSRALKYFETQSSKSPSAKLDKEKGPTRITAINNEISYAGKKPVVEETITKINIERGPCRACGNRHSQHTDCEKRLSTASPEESTKNLERSSTPMNVRSQNKAESEALTQFDRVDPVESEGNSFYAYKSNAQDQRVLNNRKRIEPESYEDEDVYEFGSSVTVNSRNLSDREEPANANNVSVSSGENSEDSGLVGESVSLDYNSQDCENRPPLPTTPMPQKMTYITEIEVSSRENNRDTESAANAESLYIMGTPEQNTFVSESRVTTNGKSASGKKPPVPPRRLDVTKPAKEEPAGKPILGVSDYKSVKFRESETPKEDSATEADGGKHEHWMLQRERDESRWAKASAQPHTVTNIVLSSSNEKTHK